jgi:hypothetical protein
MTLARLQYIRRVKHEHGSSRRVWRTSIHETSESTRMSSSFIGMLIADGSDGYQIFDGAVALLSARPFRDSGLDYSP